MSTVTGSSSRLSFSAGRRWLIGLSVLVSSVAVTALVMMVNYLGIHYHKRFYFTANQTYQLSPLSQAVLRALTNEVHVVVFFNSSEEPVLYSSVTALINEYGNRTPKIQIEKIDYVRNLQQGLLFKEKYRIPFTDDRNLILFECNGRTKIVYQVELSDYDLKQENREFKRTAFKGEQLFTSAILSVTDSGQFKAYFLTTHNEHSPDSDSKQGYQKFAALLTENNIGFSRISLIGTNDIPGDCQLLIAAGPTDRFREEELEKINQYLDHGGRLLALFNYLDGGHTGLERVLVNWGVDVGTQCATDPQSSDNGTLLIATNFFSHAIVAPLSVAGRTLVMVTARTLDRRPSSKPSGENAKVDELVATSRGGKAVTIRDGYLHPTAHDRTGPLPIAVAIEKGGIRGVPVDRDRTRIVAVGDSFFLGNSFIDLGGNRDFAVLACNWLLDRTQLMSGIMPRPVKEYRLIMTHTQRVAVRWILLAGIPGLILIVGLLVWSRRRR